MTRLQDFVVLLAVHWYGDFACQTHWQASNKSKSLVALSRHVGTYTALLALCSLVMFWWSLALVGFIVTNAALHFVTDFFTSRWSAHYFRKAHDPDLTDEERGRAWHDFFEVIGLDQFMHQIALATTLVLFL